MKSFTEKELEEMTIRLLKQGSKNSLVSAIHSLAEAIPPGHNLTVEEVIDLLEGMLSETDK